MTGAAIMLATGVAYGGQTAPASSSPAATLPPGPTLDLINQACASCHTLTTISAKRKTPGEWAATVQQMADRGAEISPEEAAAIAEYLARNLPAAPAPAKATGG